MTWAKSVQTAALSAAPFVESSVFSGDNGGCSAPARGALFLHGFAANYG
jgi:hypothetical protein